MPQETAWQAWQEWKRDQSPALDRASAEIMGRAFRGALQHRLERTGRHLLLAQVFRLPCGNGESALTPLTLTELRQLSPGLAAVWRAQAYNWKRFLTAFTAHFHSFAKSKRRRCCLTALETDLSDCHSGGRTVTRVELDKGEVWYYKPRPGRKEALWHEFLKRVNSVGFESRFLIPRIDLRDNHHWMEAVEPRTPRSITNRRQLACQAGAILYLAQLFQAVDLHAANFVIHRKFLVLVDCETFFHPETRLPAGFDKRERGLFRTGMLARGQAAPGVMATIDASPTVIAEGFSAMHAWLGRYGRKIGLHRLIARMRCDPIRLVLRPTSCYYRLLEKALERELTNGENPRQALREYLSDGLTSCLRQREETDRLLAGDIPMFFGTATRARYPLPEREFQRYWKHLRISGEQIPNATSG